MSDESAANTELVRHEQPRLLVLSAVRMLREALAQTLVLLGYSRVRVASPPLLPHEWNDMPSDVVIADVGTPQMLDLMRALVGRHPSLRIIAFGVDDDATEVLACAAAGAAGYVVRESGAAELRITIESVCRDELICSPQVAAALFRRAAHSTTVAQPSTPVGASSPESTPTRLTPREVQVLALLDRGLSNKEIGAALHISLATVKHHVHRILEKLHVRRRWAAAAAVRAAK